MYNKAYTRRFETYRRKGYSEACAHVYAEAYAEGYVEGYVEIQKRIIAAIRAYRNGLTKPPEIPLSLDLDQMQKILCDLDDTSQTLDEI